jgi:O-methyltransferase involved in polyketide biosynthesis
MIQNLKGISETLLVPLWARAVETKRLDHIIKDDKAVEMMEHIEYDFSKFDIREMPQISIIIRTELLDQATQEFMDRNPDAIIIDLGCGLDTRFSRLDNGRIRWYDIDLSEPIRIRKYFFEETDRYHMIAKSVFDYSWIDEIIAKNPVLIIAEGLLMYFNENDVEEFINKMGKRFAQSEMLFDVITSVVVEKKKKDSNSFLNNAPFLWGIKDLKEINRFNPKICILNEWNYFDYHNDRRNELKVGLKREFSGRIVHLRLNCK